MKRKIIFSLLLIPLFIISCKFGIRDIENYIKPDGEAGKLPPMENPSDINSGKAGEIVANSIIVKTKNNFDGAVFEQNGFEIKGKLPIKDEVYWYLFKTDKKLLSKALHIKGVLYAAYDRYVEAPKYTVGKKKGEKSLESFRGLIDGQPDYFDSAVGYSLTNTKALEAYKECGYGNNTVYVGILDTGINMAHKDFKISESENVVLYAKSYQTKKGFGAHYVGDNKPFTEIPIGENWDAESGHGTHCSGTICALGNNASGDFKGGINGVAWKNTKLISYQVLGGCGGGTEWSIYGSMLDLINTVNILRKAPGERTAEDKKLLPSYLQEAESQIKQKTIPVNISLGDAVANVFGHDVLNYGLKNGVLPIIAMGNEGSHTNSYPAALPGVLSVGAVDGKDKLAAFSSKGSWISITAPGVSIESCLNGGDKGTQQMSGTSMAAPFVTGTIAYLLSFDEARDLTPYQFKKLLEETADKIDGSTGFNEKYGHGRINVLEAARRIKAKNVPADDFYCSDAQVSVNVTNKGKPIALPNILVYDTTAKVPIADIGNLEGKPFTLSGLIKGHEYEIIASLGRETKKETFTASASDKTVNFDFNVDIIWISTKANKAYNGGKDPIDTKFTIYKIDQNGKIDKNNPFLKYDKDMLDTFSFFPDDDSSYCVVVEGFVDKNKVFFGGNYVIKIGDEPLTEEESLEDGTRKADENDSHEIDDYEVLARSRGNAWNQKYACNLVLRRKDNSDASRPDVDIFIITPKNEPDTRLDAPLKPMVEAVPSGIKVKWNKVEDADVKFYVVRYYIGNKLADFAVIDSNNALEHTAKNLDTTKEYTVSVQAMSNLKSKKDSSESEKSDKLSPTAN